MSVQGSTAHGKIVNLICGKYSLAGHHFRRYRTVCADTAAVDQFDDTIHHTVLILVGAHDVS